jgi:hypothetical protein
MSLDSARTEDNPWLIKEEVEKTQTPTCKETPWFKPIYCANDIVLSAVPPYAIFDRDKNGDHIGDENFAANLVNHPPHLCLFAGAPCDRGIRLHDGIHYANIGAAMMLDVHIQ